MPKALEILVATMGLPRHSVWRAAALDAAQGWPHNSICFSHSLKALFPTGGPIRGCMKGLKALGKYVDLKRMSTVGVSYGCTSDLLVSTKPQKESDRKRDHRDPQDGRDLPSFTQKQA